LIDIDPGGRRTGIAAGAPAKALAHQVAQLPNLFSRRALLRRPFVPRKARRASGSFASGHGTGHRAFRDPRSGPEVGI
jgi:hypothetical protein